MPLLVACLCAAWCSTCRGYRDTFDAAAREFTGARFVWIDVEDESDLVGPIDVENFPTLLIGDGVAPRFFGPLTPQPEILARLVRAHLDGSAGTAVGDADVRALLARVARIA